MIRRFLHRLRPVAAGIAISGLVALPPAGMIAMHRGQPCTPVHASSHDGHGAPAGDRQDAPTPSGTDCCLTCLGCATIALQPEGPLAVPIAATAPTLPVAHGATDQSRRPPVPYALPFSLPPPASIA